MNLSITGIGILNFWCDGKFINFSFCVFWKYVIRHSADLQLIFWVHLLFFSIGNDLKIYITEEGGYMSSLRCEGLELQIPYNKWKICKAKLLLWLIPGTQRMSITQMNEIWQFPITPVRISFSFSVKVNCKIEVSILFNGILD